MSSVYFLSLQFLHIVGVANATRISAVITRHIILKGAMLVSVPSAATIAAALGTNDALNSKLINSNIDFAHINLSMTCVRCDASASRSSCRAPSRVLRDSSMIPLMSSSVHHSVPMFSAMYSRLPSTPAMSTRAFAELGVCK